MFMASIIKKTYHIRKYENIEDEMKKKISVKSSGGLAIVDDENVTKPQLRSDRQRIVPITDS
jgi:hypothetical protein